MSTKETWSNFNLSWISDCNSLHSIWKFEGKCTYCNWKWRYKYAKKLIFSTILKPIFKLFNKIKSRNIPPSAHRAPRKWEAQRRYKNWLALQKPQKPSTQCHGSLAYTFNGIQQEKKHVPSLHLCTQHHPKAKTCDDSLHCFSITSKARNSHLLHPQMDSSTIDIT